MFFFYVIPSSIRGFKNHKGRRVDYPWRPMHIEASICNADRGEVDWSQAPFSTHYQDFDLMLAQLKSTLFCNVIRKSISGTT